MSAKYNQLDGQRIARLRSRQEFTLIDVFIRYINQINCITVMEVDCIRKQFKGKSQQGDIQLYSVCDILRDHGQSIACLRSRQEFNR